MEKICKITASSLAYRKYVAVNMVCSICESRSILNLVGNIVFRCKVVSNLNLQFPVAKTKESMVQYISM